MICFWTFDDMKYTIVGWKKHGFHLVKCTLFCISLSLAMSHIVLALSCTFVSSIHIMLPLFIYDHNLRSRSLKFDYIYIIQSTWWTDHSLCMHMICSFLQRNEECYNMETTNYILNVGKGPLHILHAKVFIVCCIELILCRFSRTRWLLPRSNVHSSMLGD